VTTPMCPINGCTRKIIIATPSVLARHATVHCGGCHEAILCDIVTCEQFKIDKPDDLG